MSNVAERWEYLINIRMQNPKEYSRIKSMLRHAYKRGCAYVRLRDHLGTWRWEVTMLDMQGVEVLLAYFHTNKEALQFCNAFNLDPR